MADQLTILGGATTSVAPDELERSGVLLHRLAGEASAISMELSFVDRIATRSEWDAMGAPPSAKRAELDIDQAVIVLAEVEIIAGLLGQSLQYAADGYSMTEAFARMRFESGMGDLAGAAGGMAWFGPLGWILAGGAVGAASNPQIRSHPMFVGLVREGVMQSDDAAMGFLGIPRPIARLLGDEGLGLVGPDTTAAGIAALGAAAGLVRHTPVRLVAETPPTVVQPVQGAEARLARIPSPTDEEGAQVRVERYEFDDKPDAFVAYVAGTVTFDPVTVDEPLDMESNLLNMVDASSASAESLRQALAAAGADESSPVQLVGYSQGGAADARVASTGEYSVQGILTFGSPTGQIPLPPGIPAVLVEHTDDLVPALGGRQDNSDAVLVNRRVFADGEVPTDEPVPAHLRPNYAQTARLMDASTDAQLRATLGRLDALTAGATRVTSTNYEFERVTTAR